MTDDLDLEKMSDNAIVLEIQRLLDGMEWSPDTLEAIAEVLSANGYEIRTIDEAEEESE
jgi:hypothetical protein